MKKFLPSSIAEIHPGFAAFSVMLGGFVTVALSFFWDFGSVSAGLIGAKGETIVKEVGFGPAFNWSFMLTIFLPAAIILLCKSYSSFVDGVTSFSQSGMFFDRNLIPVSGAALSKHWQDVLDNRKLILYFLIMVGALFSYWEWYDYSAEPLLKNDIKLAKEWDWSVGALLDAAGNPAKGEGAARLKNAVLSLFAFSGQAMAVAVISALIFHALMIASFFSSLTRSESTLILIPDPKSGDRRRGFEHLSSFLEYTLMLVGILYSIFYLSRIQNIYLRSKTGSILKFFSDDLVLGLVKEPWSLGTTVEIVKQGLSGDVGANDYSSIMVCLGAFAVMMVSAYVIGSTARDAAKRAKNELQTLAHAKPDEISKAINMTPEEIAQSMKDMVFWPVNYIKAGQFFGLVLLGIFCIFFYRLGVILVAILLLRIFVEVGKYIFGKTSG